MTWFLFYDQMMLKLTFIACNTMCSIATCFVIFQDKFASPQYRALRILPFFFLFSTSVIPNYFAFSREHLDHGMKMEILYPYLGCFGYLAIGSVFFATQLPERFFPFKFDIFGHSHSIFHVLVIFAISSFHVATQKAFEYRGQLDLS